MLLAYLDEYFLNNLLAAAAELDDPRITEGVRAFVAAKDNLAEALVVL